jgi:bifunctional non-homologous end joining protein LigD
MARPEKQDTVPPPSAAEMTALAAIEGNGEWELHGRVLKLTNLDKVLFPAGTDRSGIEQPAFTKRDLIAHYATVGPQMVPYLRGRGLNMHRFPNGVDKPGFWHKAVPSHAPDWIPTWEYDHPSEGTTREYFVVDSVPALVWMANFGVIEMHAWTSPCTAPDEPSYALIDLDPGTTTTFDDLVTLALLHRTALDHLGVMARPKVTGQRGIQIWVPVEPGLRFQDTREWVEKLSRAVGSMVPDLVSWAWETRARKGLARLDYTQNAHNKTLVAPYSVRAAIGAPVSMPISWDELDDPDLRPDGWNIATAPARIADVGDLFAPVLGGGQRLPDL